MVENLPKNAEDITSAWLSRVLGRAVSVCDVERIGVDEGFTGGGLFRVSLDGETMVAKLSPEGAVLRASFAAANAREVQFYQMSAGRELPVPACTFGAFDGATGASALLIEDMGALRSVPFLDGCDGGDVAPVVDALAQVHAAFWDSAEIADLPVLALLEEFDFAQMWARYPQSVEALQIGVELPSWFIGLGDWLAGDPKGVFERIMKGPQTVVHRDAQVDNVLFGDTGAVLLDWQFMGKGKGVHDLAFFLISSTTPKVRRECEAAMIARYHGALGVAGYALEDCQRDYVHGALWRLFITAMATTQLDNSGTHKRGWRRADLTRLVAFCEDHRISPETLAF